MKRQFILIGAMLLLAALVVSSVPLWSSDDKGKKEPISWLTFEQGLAASKKEKKMMVVDFYTTWCGWCKVLERDVLSDPRVAAALTNYVCIRVDVDADPGVAVAYGVSSLPRLVVADGSGRVMADQVGFADADRVLAFLEEARSGRGAAELPEARAERAIGALRDGLEAAAPGPRLPDAAVAALAHADPGVREEARALLRKGGDGWLPAIRAAALDDSLGVRIAAWQMLKDLGAPPPPCDPWAPREEQWSCQLPETWQAEEGVDEDDLDNDCDGQEDR